MTVTLKPASSSVPVEKKVTVYLHDGVPRPGKVSPEPHTNHKVCVNTASMCKFQPVIQTQGLLIASQMLLPLSHWDSGIGVEDI